MTESKSDIRFQYNETIPCEEISHLLFCFFEFTIEGVSKKPIPHEVFPDGCISLMYRRNEKLGINLLLLKGLSLEPFHTEVFTGDIHWRIKLSPATCGKILRCDPQNIPTQPLFDDKILPHLTTNLSNKLSKCKNLKESITIFTELLQKLGLKLLRWNCPKLGQERRMKT